MPREIDLFSLLVPSLLPILAVCVLIFIGLDLVLAKFNFYNFTWHPSLFRVALFAAMFSGTSLLFWK
ncbi:hypothetical protein P3T18_007313 [Paraburkholderia sp. GAS199]|uniref:DUF1656 domain-containing protein n=1 Tax=Paraburkholderia sp. GAS199 TaxID=3035126 RepID=UPI003D1B0317